MGTPPDLRGFDGRPVGTGRARRDGEEGAGDHRGHLAGRDDKERGTGPRLNLAGDPAELTCSVLVARARPGSTDRRRRCLAAQLRAAPLGV